MNTSLASSNSKYRKIIHNETCKISLNVFQFIRKEVVKEIKISIPFVFVPTVLQCVNEAN